MRWPLLRRTRWCSPSRGRSAARTCWTRYGGGWASTRSWPGCAPPAGAGHGPTAERVLFGLVANRALAPSSKLAAAEWMSQDVHIDRLGAVTDDACYRATDWLHQVRGQLEKQRKSTRLNSSHLGISYAV